MNVGAPVKVVAPKVIPVVPDVAFVPPVIVKGYAPIERVPKVWVVPALVAVALSDWIVTVPPTVTLCALTDPSVFKSRIPPFNDMACPATPRPATLLTAKVPEFNVVPAVYVFATFIVRIPLFCLATAVVPVPSLIALVLTFTAPELLKVTVFAPGNPPVIPPERVNAFVPVVATCDTVKG